MPNRSRTEQEARTADAFSSVVGAWLADCLTENTAYLLAGRAGPDVRAAIKHVRAGRRLGTAPLIVEPERNVLLAWTVPVAAHVRDRLGSAHDATISTQLQRERLTRERLDARPGPDDRGTVGMPLWVVPNGWQGVEVEMPMETGNAAPGPRSCPGGVRDPRHARAGTHAGGK